MAGFLFQLAAAKVSLYYKHMNIFTILGGLAVLCISSYVGYIAVTLFIQGGVTPVFGGIAMSVISVMALVLGIVLIGMGFAGIISWLRKGRA